jgi:TfoX/Sxy family transcriptional regulator of competence genes
MGSRVDTMRFICDQAGLGARLTYRKMFGEYALYLDGKVVALVCDDQLFLKPTPAGRTLLGPVPEAPPYPGSKPFLLLSAELDNPEHLGAALEVTAQALPAPKPKARAKQEAKVAVKVKVKVKVQTFVVALHREGVMTAIPVPFDPGTVFGKVRAPVKVTLNGYSYRSTIFSMGGRMFIPLRASHRQAAGVEGDEKLKIRVELDTGERTVSLPPDLRKALAASKGALERWEGLSHTHQREHVEAVEGARKPETRVRRINAALAALRQHR